MKKSSVLLSKNICSTNWRHHLEPELMGKSAFSPTSFDHALPHFTVLTLTGFQGVLISDQLEF